MMDHVMQAIVQARYGSPDVLALRDIPRPAPGEGDVLVRVRAASIFFGDWRLIRGTPFVVRFATGLRRPRNAVPGLDVAGVVEAVGANVTRLRPGDEVFGWCAGAFAEFACAPEDHFEAMPSTLSFEEAAAVPEAALTALQGLRDQGRVGPGQRVLVIGASGGVGTFAVQIAKALGAEVTGVCSTRNLELVRSIGADHVIDYTIDDLTRRTERYDVIFQAAGTASPRRLRRLLTSSGTLVLSSGQGRFAGIDRIIAAMLLRPFVRQRMAVYVTNENHADLVTLKDLIEAGRIRPVIDRRFPLPETPDAVRYLEAGHTRGKVVITVGVAPA
jgi:NADPH:quinone reductase-like Zn-dependent oxidoreductase